MAQRGSIRSRGQGKLTFARWNIHSHSFKADASLMPFLALSDSVVVAGSTPSNAMPRFPKSQNEEEVTPVRIARLDGSAVRWISCWVRDSTGPAIVS